VNNPANDFDAEEKKVLSEALSGEELRVGPSEEYVAQLRCRLLSVATSGQVVRGKSNRRVLLGSILGACAAAILIAAIWLLNSEPAWASAIRMAREQAWIHAQIEQDGVPKGAIWVSPERDIVAVRLGSVIQFFDYKQDAFFRYDSRERATYRASQPMPGQLTRELLSVSSLAAVFRRSPGAPSLVPDQPVERWRLQSGIVDGIPSDQYEIVMRSPDHAPTTLLLTIDKRQSLPRSLTIVEGESHTMTCRFDYPSAGPLDERSPLLGIPADAPTIDVDRTGKLSVVALSLKRARHNFDDYTAFSVTSPIDDAGPLTKRDTKRVLRKANKWRVDRVDISDPNFTLPKDHDLAVIALQANKGLFRFAPEYICDGRDIHCYVWRGESTPDGRPIKSFRVTDDSQPDSISPRLLFPERACRPIFELGTFDHIFDVSDARDDPREGLIKVSVFRTPNAKNASPLEDTYWLDPNLGNVAIRMVLRPIAPGTKGSQPSPPRAQEVTLRDFKQSPDGFWYPRVVNHGQISRFYVDFTDVPSDEMFHPAP
jgi:hypothetical protein